MKVMSLTLIIRLLCMKAMRFIIFLKIIQKKKMPTNKKELRLHYKNLRKGLSPDEIEEKSLAVANELLQLPIWDKTYYHVFLPIEEQKEVNTEYVLHLLSGKDKEIVISKSDFETRKMSHFLLTDSTKIKKNEYNIPEPVNGLPVSSETI